MKTYESNPICAAIVGTGFIAQFHARAIHALSGVDLVSICDANLIAAKSFAETWNVAKAYASVDEMLGNEKGRLVAAPFVSGFRFGPATNRARARALGCLPARHRDDHRY